jgi:hypothetical protein
MAPRSKWRKVVRFTLRPLYLLGKSRWHPLNRRLGGLQSSSGRCGKENKSQSRSSSSEHIHYIDWATAAPWFWNRCETRNMGSLSPNILLHLCMYLQESSICSKCTNKCTRCAIILSSRKRITAHGKCCYSVSQIFKFLFPRVDICITINNVVNSSTDDDDDDDDYLIAGTVGVFKY